MVSTMKIVDTKKVALRSGLPGVNYPDLSVGRAPRMRSRLRVPHRTSRSKHGYKRRLRRLHRARVSPLPHKCWPQ